jgi:hypothetical protein
MRLKYFIRRPQPYFCTIEAIHWNATRKATVVEIRGFTPARVPYLHITKPEVPTLFDIYATHLALVTFP